MSTKRILLATLLCAVLAGCDGTEPDNGKANQPPVVKLLPIEPAGPTATRLSGTIEAERRNPLSFQIGGRIVARYVDAGQHVTQGALLFELDERDLRQAKLAADAQVTAAKQALQTTEDELARIERLYKSRFVSEQARDQAKLRVAEAQTRAEAVIASAKQAANAEGYAQLRAPADGIVTEIFGEVGQVVTPGQAVGDFAFNGAREIEVYLPQGFKAPVKAVAQVNGQTFEATRQEVSGAADRTSRTFRARYGLPASANQLAIGTIAELSMSQNATDKLMSVPLGAIDERGQGPNVWIVKDGKVVAVPVTVVSLSSETAHIQTNLPVDTPVVAMGAHLLKPNMAVRVQPR